MSEPLTTRLRQAAETANSALQALLMEAAAALEATAVPRDGLAALVVEPADLSPLREAMGAQLDRDLEEARQRGQQQASDLAGMLRDLGRREPVVVLMLGGGPKLVARTDPEGALLLEPMGEVIRRPPRLEELCALIAPPVLEPDPPRRPWLRQGDSPGTAARREWKRRRRKGKR